MALDLRERGDWVGRLGDRLCPPLSVAEAPVLDHRGEIVHRGGVTPLPGLYVIGLTFLSRRRSSFIDGCGLDAEDLAPIVRARLGRTANGGSIRQSWEAALSTARASPMGR